MKKHYLFTVIIALCTISLSAQEKNIELSIPAYPAKSILGNPSMEIPTVGNYSALVSSLTNSISSSGNSIPANLGLEFVPHYMSSNDASIEDLGKTDIFRDLRISVATTEVQDFTANSTFSRLGIGFRTVLAPGKLDVDKVRSANASLSFDDRLEIYADYIEGGNEYNEGFLLSSKQFSFSDDQKLVIINAINDLEEKTSTTIVAKLRQMAGEVLQLNIENKNPYNFYDLNQRHGLVVQLSAAVAVDFPEGDASFQQINRWGLWTDFNYNLGKESKYNPQLSALLRVSNYSYDPDVLIQDNGFIDFGLNFSTAVIPERLYIAGEAIFRGKVVTEEGAVTLKYGENESETKFDFTVSTHVSDQVLFQVSFDQYLGTWSSGSVDPSQLLLGIVYALK